MTRSLLLTTALLSAIGANAQVYKVDTAFTTEIVNGNKASCAALASKNSTYGINHNRNVFFLLAEDFTVPAGQTWNLDTVIVYSYQTGSTTTSSITEATLQINQTTVTGTNVFGDTTTNRLIASDWTGIYRIDSSAAGKQGTTRPIMRVKIKLTPTKTLTAGTYWMTWGCKGSASITGGVFCPPKVTPAKGFPTGQNAMQHSPGGVWHAASDTLFDNTIVNVGFSFMLKGPQKPSGVNNLSAADAGILEQNVPNPFSGSTVIAYELPEAGPVKLDVYNTLGQRVATLLDGQQPKGKGEATFNAAGLPSGKYFYRLQTAGGMLTKSLEILR